MPSDEHRAPACRERLLTYGADSLTDSELLSVLLGSKDLDAAGRLLTSIGGLSGFIHLDRTTLRSLGVRDARAALILAHLELQRRLCREDMPSRTLSMDEASVYITVKYLRPDQEVLGALFFDAQQRLLGGKAFFAGVRDRARVEVRPILREAFKYPTVDGILLFHNHTNGNLEPSPEDFSFTRTMINAVNWVGLQLLDHMVIGHRCEFLLVRSRKELLGFTPDDLT